MKIYSRKIVLQALKEYPERIDKIFIYEKIKRSSISDILKLIKQSKIVHNFVPRQRLNKLIKGNHQGIVAIVSEVKYYNLQDTFKSKLVLILDRITDNHNLGAIIRTAAATLVDYIIIPKRHTATINEVVAKVSAGGIDFVKMVKVSNLSKAIDELKDKGFFVVGTSLDTNKFYNKITYRFPLALVFGSEGEGIRKGILNRCDELVKIPIHNVESLNVSVSAGIMLYHIYQYNK